MGARGESQTILPMRGRVGAVLPGDPSQWVGRAVGGQDGGCTPPQGGPCPTQGVQHLL